VGEHYLPGAAVLSLSHAAAGRSLVALCRPILIALSECTGLMANLQVLEADRSRVVDVVRPAHLSMINDLRGETLAAHRFAGPLALVALLGDDDLAPYLGGQDLSQDIDRVRRTGFALEKGRHQHMVTSLSRAVPGPGGRPLCAFTLVGPDAEFGEPALSTLKRRLTEAADTVTATLAGVTSGPGR
jgi:DNA-binding IclR family transcriptional regulator